MRAAAVSEFAAGAAAKASGPADAVAQLEAEIDAKMRERMPQAYAEMLEARRERTGEPPPERIVRVSPPASDEAIEALLTTLMTEAFVEAQRSFAMARGCSAAGQPAGMRDIHFAQGARLCNALGMLTVALARHKGRPARVMVEHRHQHHHVHQRIS
jgi:hypothetical protein